MSIQNDNVALVKVGNCNITISGESKEEVAKITRLVENAESIYAMLKEELNPTSDFGGILSFSREYRLSRIISIVENNLNV